jgi:membrane protease YdiL (CAAX protease family)
MQTYLKTRPIWIQLLLFIGMAFGILMALSLIGDLVLVQLTGLSLFKTRSVATIPGSDTDKLIFLRGGLLIQFLGMFVIPSVLFAYFSDPRPKNYLGLKPPFRAMYWALGILVMLAAIPMTDFIGVLNRQLPLNPETRQLVQSMEDEAAGTLRVLLNDPSAANLALNIIFIAAFAGIGEELFFRGVLQRLFIRGTRSPWAGIIITAFLFSFFHFQFFGFVPRLLLGILLGAIYWYSGSLWTAIVAHFLYDAFLITMAYFNPALVTSPDAFMVDKSYLAVAALVSTLIVIAIVWVMKKASKANYNDVYRDDESSPSPNDFTF